MAQLLILNKNNTHSDPVKNAQSCYKRGDIVVIAEDGHTWSNLERLPDFVLLKVPTLDYSNAIEYTSEWTQTLGYTIVQTNLVVDGARIKIFTTNPGLSIETGITKNKVESFINDWGGSVVSDSQNDIRFEILVKDIYRSTGFWGTSPVAIGIVINEESYDQSTGIHIATIDLSNSAVTLDRARRKVEEVGAEVISFTSDTLTCEFPREIVVKHFMDTLKEAQKRSVRRRQFYITETDAQTIQDAGGELTVTIPQLRSKVLDKAQ